ncbi:hypothetical protein E2P81_ATG03515 [Venturia nashicola]|nr:hypothetical protein E2P81_ATG03515 [Venturia nashicola]
MRRIVARTSITHPINRSLNDAGRSLNDAGAKSLGCSTLMWIQMLDLLRLDYPPGTIVVNRSRRRSVPVALIYREEHFQVTLAGIYVILATLKNPPNHTIQWLLYLLFAAFNKVRGDGRHEPKRFMMWKLCPVTPSQL